MPKRKIPETNFHIFELVSYVVFLFQFLFTFLPELNNLSDEHKN